MSVPQASDAPAPAFGLSLHIRHPSVDPAEISSELQLTPEAAFKAGEPRSRAGASGGVHGETYWVAQMDPPFWRAGYRRTFDPQPSVEPEAAAQALPEDRGARLKLLIQRGRLQGYLTQADLQSHLPDDSAESLQGVERTLAELGIPVHAQASPALAAIQRVGAIQQTALTDYLGRHPSMQLTDVLGLVCLRLVRQHEPFLKKIRAGGGSVRLLVTVSAKAVHGLTLSPELLLGLAQLGITLEMAMAPGPSRAKTRSA